MLGVFALGQEALASLEPCVVLVTTDAAALDELAVTAGTRGELTPTAVDEPDILDVLTTIC
jgi:hypothetical protein